MIGLRLIGGGALRHRRMGAGFTACNDDVIGADVSPGGVRFCRAVVLSCSLALCTESVSETHSGWMVK